jgi:hypothetical protein
MNPAQTQTQIRDDQRSKQDRAANCTKQQESEKGAHAYKIKATRADRKANQHADKTSQHGALRGEVLRLGVERDFVRV